MHVCPQPFWPWIAALLVLPAVSAADDPLFAPGARYPVGDTPQSVASGDLNDDGRPDLVTTNITSDDLSVLLNRGDGTFAPQVRYPMSSQPRVLAIADLDGDGHQDVAVGRQSEVATLAIHWGSGDGTIGPSTPMGTFTGFPDGVRLVDLDHDADLDVVVGSVLASKLAIWINSGNRAFEEEVLYDLSMGNGYPSDFAAGDLDQDTFADIATASTLSATPAGFLLNDGHGIFGPAAPYTDEAGTLASVAIGRLDGDERGDIATFDFGSSAVDVYRNDGNSTFALIGSFWVGSTSSVGAKVRLGDLNGDGWLDAVIALNTTNPAVPVLLGNGAGGFGPPTSYGADPGVASIEIADLDGDSDLDVAVACRELDSVVILRNQSSSPSDIPDLSTMRGFELKLLGPNPMTERASFLYRAPRSATVSLTIHDAAGRLIRTLVDRAVEAGENRAEWDGRSSNGSLVEPGVYFYRMTAAEFAAHGKIQVIR